MKTEEQIKLAKQTIKVLQDYAELGATFKKLKTAESKEMLDDYLGTLTQILNANVKML